MRYWIKQGLLSGLWYVTFFFLFELFTHLVAGDPSAVEPDQMGTPLLIICVFALLINFEYYKTIIPTVVSLCQTRANIALGLQLNRMIGLTILTAIACIFFGLHTGALLICSYLYFTATGSVMGAGDWDMTKISRVILFIVVILINVFGFTALWTLASRQTVDAQTGWWFLGVSILLYGLFSVYEAKKLQELS